MLRGNRDNYNKDRVYDWPYCCLAKEKQRHTLLSRKSIQGVEHPVTIRGCLTAV